MKTFSVDRDTSIDQIIDFALEHGQTVKTKEEITTIYKLVSGKVVTTKERATVITIGERGE